MVHRYVGLAMAAFLLLAGLTGSVIAFYPALDGLLNPELVRAKPPAVGAPMLDPFVLRDKLLEQLPEGQTLDSVVLHRVDGEAVNYWVDGREVFVDPYTGKVLGSRTFGDVTEGRKSLLTFVYRLHFSLALDDVGRWLMGGVALLWTADCFVGAYLTFPPSSPSRGSPRRSWLARWLPAWLLKANKLFALVFTWHRASGLWIWLMFLVFAWSSVALNLNDTVYDPLMARAFGEHRDDWEKLPILTPPKKTPAIAPREALAIGRRLADAEGHRRGFVVLGERWIGYDAERGVYIFGMETTRDISERLAESSLYIDGDTGEVRGFNARTGEHTGETITSWLVALHFGAVRLGGLPYRIFVCMTGVVVALLSVTGVWIWLKKRPARVAKRRLTRAAARSPALHGSRRL